MESKVELYCGDCLEVLKQTPDAFVDMAILDPPYYKIVASEWDRQWKSIREYVEWLEPIILEVKRVLKPNGSLYIFGDDQNIAYVQVMVDQHLTLLNNIVWHKINNYPQKASFSMRSWVPMTERILFYTPQLCRTGLESVKLDINNFVSLRDYFRRYQEAIGVGLKKINEILGHRRAEHAFYWNSTQWDLPTPEVYAELRRVFPADGFAFREYEDLRRTFNADRKTHDVISGPMVDVKDTTDHPTTKPLWLIKRLIAVSSNPGMTVLDPFLGSGTSADAAIQLGRHFIGIEKDENYFKIAERRIKQAQLQLRLDI